MTQEYAHKQPFSSAAETSYNKILYDSTSLQMDTDEKRIIIGPEVHSTTWKRLTDLLDQLETKLEDRENEWSHERHSKYYWDNPTWDEENAYDFDDAIHYLESITRQVEDENRSGLKELFDNFFEVALGCKANIEDLHEEIEEILELLEITEGSALYVPDRQLIYIPELLSVLSKDILGMLAQDPQKMYSLHPRKFEEVVAEIFLRNGFQVELTKTTRDGGKDIIAIHQKLGIQMKYIIECKRYSKERKISCGIVQRLLGVKVATSANKAILATTSFFSRDAQVFAANNLWDLELKDYNDIVTWLKSFAVN